MDNEREKLLEVKELVNQKKYDEALALLHTMPDNPTAQKWQAQVEKLITRERPSSAPDVVQVQLHQAQELIARQRHAEARALLMTIQDDPQAQELIAQLDELDRPQLAFDAPTEADFRPSREPEQDIRREFSTQPEARKMPPVDLAEARQQAQAALVKIGMDYQIAVKALAVAAASGAVAGLLDSIIGLPGSDLVFAFGWIVAALNGPTYAIWRGKIDRAGVIASAVVGLVAMLLWFIVIKLLTGDVDWMEDEANAYNIFKAWRNEYMNLLKVPLAGALIGLLSLGWYALLPRVPDQIQNLRLPEGLGRKKQ